MKTFLLLVDFALCWFCADAEYRAILTKTWQNQAQLSNLVKKSCGSYSEHGVVCRDFGPTLGVYHKGACSAPGLIRNLVDRWFLAACKVHDVCYSLQTQSRESCDTQFYFNMEYSCVNLQKFLKPFCHSMRAVIYSLVEKFGEKYFKLSARDCKVLI